MNVLLIGSGGREHALAYKIKQSKILNKLFILPGNPGTEKLGDNVSFNENNFEEILSFCRNNNIELVVVGPELPLVAGIADFLRENNILVFGPNKAAAEIESSKSFAKYLMSKYKIPTAKFEEFNYTEYDKAKEYLIKHDYPCVIKADGLAAGKGVLICQNIDEAIKGLEEIFIKKIFGKAGDKIVVEEFLQGEEASIFAITDSEDFICLPSAQDHKRVGDNDTGKNTGGMGAYSPAPIVSSKILSEIENHIIKPAIEAMKFEGREFIGCLYCGVMIKNESAKVVEFNCRFGDPETQVVVPLIKGDFLELLYSAAKGKINKNSVIYSGGCAVSVVAASKGYPDVYQKGFKIKGIENIKDNIIVFHAGTKKSGNDVVTSGGRVLNVTAVLNKNDLKLAKELAYDALNNIHFDGMYFRKDIADKGIKKI